MGYHGNQCFDVLDRWQDICRLPVLVMLDVYLSGYADVYQPVPEENSALRKWLGRSYTQLQRTRPASRLAKGIDDWVGILVSISSADGEMYTFKTHNHSCCVHVLPMLAREGNLVQYATFSTEHDNSAIRHDLRGHTSVGGGRDGDSRASDLRQLFDQRIVMRCDAVLGAAPWLQSRREIAVHSRCDCEECHVCYGDCRSAGGI
jgi:hypothetical protein